jgi:hypothetical protein
MVNNSTTWRDPWKLQVTRLSPLATAELAEKSPIFSPRRPFGPVK